MPNQVILVITDDQGYPDLGCTGNPWLKTPHIDRLHDEGVRFHDFHVQPLCTPTRGALMSGHHPMRNGAWATCWGRSILRRDETTIADIFAANGYRTALFGKWHLGDNYPYRPFDRGFEHVVAHKGGGVGQTPDFWGNNYFDDTYFHNGQAREHIGYCTDIWFEEAMDFIEANHDRDFFCVISTNAPHSPYLVADKYAEPYRGNPDIVEPEFYGMIANIDENVGTLRAKLDELGIANDTLFMFMTDNGSSGSALLDDDLFPTRGYNAGLRGKKGHYYDGGHRVPFFASLPGRGIGDRDVNELCLDIDFLPTMVDLFDLKAPDDLHSDGRSFASLLTGDAEELEDRKHVLKIKQSTEPPPREHGAVITRRWRLVGCRELYDIKADPGQLDDVADQHPDIVAELQAYNDQWYDQMQASIDEPCRLLLGHEAENPTTICSMDVLGDVAWQQAHVVNALKSSGTWNVRFAEPGRYRFQLRRWPRELPLPIDGMVSNECARSLVYPGAEGKAITPAEAILSLDKEEWRGTCEAGQETVTFELDIEQPKDATMQAAFLTEEERYGAWYVDIQRL